MTGELRLVLLLGGLIIFGYIVWDAKRRKKSDSKIHDSENLNSEKTYPISQEIIETDQDKLDSEGYDELGLTQARVAKGPNKISQKKTPNAAQAEPLSESLSESLSQQKDERVEPSFNEDSEIEPNQLRKEIEKNFSNSEEVLSDDVDENIKDSSNLENMQKPETVITINLMADSDGKYFGSDLLQEFLTLGFKYGDMGDFHRYQNANGQGERWFCLANAINPGSFDLENMDNFSTPGLTLFMLLPGPQKPLEAFENMINAANKLQTTFGGKLEDGSHSALTQQRIQHYREEILTFQRQHLAKINHPDEV